MQFWYINRLLFVLVVALVAVGDARHSSLNDSHARRSLGKRNILSNLRRQDANGNGDVNKDNNNNNQPANGQQQGQAADPVTSLLDSTSISIPNLLGPDPTSSSATPTDTSSSSPAETSSSSPDPEPSSSSKDGSGIGTFLSSLLGGDQTTTSATPTPSNTDDPSSSSNGNDAPTSTGNNDTPTSTGNDTPTATATSNDASPSTAPNDTPSATASPTTSDDGNPLTSIVGGITSDLSSVGGGLTSVLGPTSADPTPTSTGGDAPSSTGGDAPSSTGGDAPSSTGGDAPSSTGGDAPTSTGGDAPTSSSTGVLDPITSVVGPITSGVVGPITSGVSSVLDPNPTSSPGETEPGSTGNQGSTAAPGTTTDASGIIPTITSVLTSIVGNPGPSTTIAISLPGTSEVSKPPTDITSGLPPTDITSGLPPSGITTTLPPSGITITDSSPLPPSSTITSQPPSGTVTSQPPSGPVISDSSPTPVSASSTVTDPATLVPSVTTSGSVVISFPSGSLEPSTVTETTLSVSTAFVIPSDFTFLTQSTLALASVATSLADQTLTDPDGVTETPVPASATTLSVAALPSDLPGRIYPKVALDTNQDLSQYTLISILFDQQLNWPFVIKNDSASSQVFAYMPSIISTALGLSQDQVKTFALQVYIPDDYKSPSDQQKLGTMFLSYIPQAQVDTLAGQIRVKSSAFYNGVAQPLVRALAQHVVPSFSLLSVKDPNSQDGTSGAASGGASRTRQDAIIGVVSALGGIAVLVLGFLGYRAYVRKQELKHKRLSDPPDRYIGERPADREFDQDSVGGQRRRSFYFAEDSLRGYASVPAHSPGAQSTDQFGNRIGGYAQGGQHSPPGMSGDEIQQWDYTRASPTQQMSQRRNIVPGAQISAPILRGSTMNW